MFNLIAAQYGSVSDIEIIWTLIAAFGLLFSIFNVRESHIDRKVLKIANVKNGRKMIADYAFVAECCRSAIQLIFLSIGVLAMTYPDASNSLDQPWNITLLSFLFRWGLIISATLISLKSFLAWKLRRELRLSVDSTPLELPSTTDVTGQVTITPDVNGQTLHATLEGRKEEE